MPPINLLTKLSLIQNEVEIRKTSESQIQNRKYKYADLNTVVAAAKPVLDKYQVVVRQTLNVQVTNNGTILDQLFTTVTDLESGEEIGDIVRLFLTRDDPQAQGSAITYARRYAYVTILGLLADEDDDGAAASQPAVTTVRRESPLERVTDVGVASGTSLPAPQKPPAARPPVGRPPVGPGEVTGPQLKKLGFEFGRTGFANDDQRHTYASLLVGHEVESLNELSKAEAHKLIEALVGEPDDA